MPIKTNPQRKLPFEILEQKTLELVDLVVFGSKMYRFFETQKKYSLERRGETSIIVGKNDETKGLKVYLPSIQKIIITRHVRNVGMWWSTIRPFCEAIPTLLLAPGRPINGGGTPERVSCLVPLTLCTVGGRVALF